MKTYLLLPLVLLGLLAGACKAIDPTAEFAEYTDCVVYAHDYTTGTGIATDYATIKVTGDVASGYFSLDFMDFKLAAHDNVRSAKVNGLLQLLQDKKDEQSGQTEVLYTFFRKEGDAYADGDMTVADMRFGWLSTVYWASFKSDNGRIGVWSLPREVEMYANRNTIVDARGDSHYENAIHPRYDMEFDVNNSTVTFRAAAVKYPMSSHTTTTFDFSSLTWEALPVVFDEHGFTITKDEFSPVTNGERGQYVIKDFRCDFAADYDGERKAQFTITRVSDGATLKVTTNFDYFRARI